MDRRDFVKQSLGTLGTAYLLPGALLEQAGGKDDPYAKSLPLGDDDYYDKRLPNNIPVAPFVGDRYEAEVPDTIDLADCAERAINGATRLNCPEWDYSVVQVMSMNINPAILNVSSGALLNIQPKYTEALPLLRTMCGSTFNIDTDGKLIGALVRVTGKDGLCYQPVQNRPWAFIDPVMQKAGKPYSDLFGEGRQLRAYGVWYMHDRNPLWKKLAEKKVGRLLEICMPEEGACYFRLGRGYSPWYKETGGPVVPLGDVGVIYDVKQGMVGGAAAQMAAWTAQGAVTWYRLTGHEPALKLAERLGRHLMEYSRIIDDVTGERLIDHPTSTTHVLLSNLCLALGMTPQDQGIIKWSQAGFEYWLRTHDPDKCGIIFGADAGQIADCIQSGILLSRTGAADYWDDVDRWVRNTFLPMQVTQADVDRLKSRPVTCAGDPSNKGTYASFMFYLNSASQPLNKPLVPGIFQPEDATDRCMGGWFATLESRGAMIGDGCGNSWRALYLVWDGIVKSHEGELRVNLLMNRASPWADVDSYIPYEGKVVLRMKTDKDLVLVRIPRWTDWDRVSCKVNDSGHTWQWSERQRGYISLRGIKAGDKIVVEFPMRQWTIPTELKLSAKTTTKCRVTLRGNTVTDISEKVPYPWSAQGKYSGERAGTRKARRFVSKEEFAWW